MTKREMADWLVDLCLMFGATYRTSYTVAGLLVEDLDEAKLAKLNRSYLGRKQLPAIRSMTRRQLRRALSTKEASPTDA